MNEFAANIGWIVIIVAVILAIGRFAGEIDKEKQNKNGGEYYKKIISYRIAARQIYQQSDDPAVREEVKHYAQQYLGGWSLLDLDITDNEFRTKYSDAHEAEAQIKIRGRPLGLVDGALKPRW